MNGIKNFNTESRDYRMSRFANRVMVIENDPTLSERIEDRLNQLGYELFICRTAGEAIDVLDLGWKGIVVLNGDQPDADERTIYERVSHLVGAYPLVYIPGYYTDDAPLNGREESAFAVIGAAAPARQVAEAVDRAAWTMRGFPTVDEPVIAGRQPVATPVTSRPMPVVAQTPFVVTDAELDAALAEDERWAA